MNSVPALTASSAPPLTERIQTLDIVRGFAVLAILLTNFRLGDARASSVLDHASTWFIEFFVEGSFFPLFSLLFGVGFAVQLLRAEQSGSNFTLRYLRRCVSLFGIGVVHYVFLLMNGDILRPYAFCGLFLIPLRRARPGVLLGIAGVALAVVLMTCPPESDPGIMVGPPWRIDAEESLYSGADRRDPA
jgi:uncharacterized protein